MWHFLCYLAAKFPVSRISNNNCMNTIDRQMNQVQNHSQCW